MKLILLILVALNLQAEDRCKLALLSYRANVHYSTYMQEFTDVEDREYISIVLKEDILDVLRLCKLTKKEFRVLMRKEN